MLKSPCIKTTILLLPMRLVSDLETAGVLSTGDSVSTNNVPEQLLRGQHGVLATSSSLGQGIAPTGESLHSNPFLLLAALPGSNSVIQNPAAMDSTQSFHSAVSYQAEHLQESTHNWTVKNSDDRSIHVPITPHHTIAPYSAPYQKWRASMVASALSHFKMT